MSVHATLIFVLSYLSGEENGDAQMKFTVPGIVITALLVASPAFAQYSNTGNTSAPGASVAKDDTMKATKSSKKHMTSTSHKKHTASYKHRKAMSSKAQANPRSGNTSHPGDKGITKDDTTPKSR